MSKPRPKAKKLDVVVSQASFEHFQDYLALIKIAPHLMGARLRHVLSKTRLDKITVYDFIDALIKTKKPVCFAEDTSHVKADGTDWTLEEVSLLGQIGFKVPVKAFSRQTYRPSAKDYHSDPFDAVILSTNGCLLDGNAKKCDEEEIFGVNLNGEITEAAYLAYYEKRLLALLKSVDQKGIVVVPKLGAGAFGGKYREKIQALFPEMLERLIEKHKNDLPHIEAVILRNDNLPTDKSKAQIKEFKRQNDSRIKLIEYGGVEAFSDPSQYPGNLDSQAKMYVVTASDHLAFLGCDAYLGSEATQEGGSTIRTDLLSRITGFLGRFVGGLFKPNSRGTFEDACDDSQIQLGLGKLIIDGHEDREVKFSPHYRPRYCEAKKSAAYLSGESYLKPLTKQELENQLDAEKAYRLFKIFKKYDSVSVKDKTFNEFFELAKKHGLDRLESIIKLILDIIRHNQKLIKNTGYMYDAKAAFEFLSQNHIDTIEERKDITVLETLKNLSQKFIINSYSHDYVLKNIDSVQPWDANKIIAFNYCHQANFNAQKISEILNNKEKTEFVSWMHQNNLHPKSDQINDFVKNFEKGFNEIFEKYKNIKKIFAESDSVYGFSQLFLFLYCTKPDLLQGEKNIQSFFYRQQIQNDTHRIQRFVGEMRKLMGKQKEAKPDEKKWIQSLLGRYVFSSETGQDRLLENIESLIKINDPNIILDLDFLEFVLDNHLVNDHLNNTFQLFNYLKAHHLAIEIAQDEIVDSEVFKNIWNEHQGYRDQHDTSPSFLDKFAKIKQSHTCKVTLSDLRDLDANKNNENYFLELEILANQEKVFQHQIEKNKFQSFKFKKPDLEKLQKMSLCYHFTEDFLEYCKTIRFFNQCAENYQNKSFVYLVNQAIKNNTLKLLMPRLISDKIPDKIFVIKEIIAANQVMLNVGSLFNKSTLDGGDLLQERSKALINLSEHYLLTKELIDFAKNDANQTGIALLIKNQKKQKFVNAVNLLLEHYKDIEINALETLVKKPLVWDAIALIGMTGNELGDKEKPTDTFKCSRTVEKFAALNSDKINLIKNLKNRGFLINSDYLNLNKDDWSHIQFLVENYAACGLDEATFRKIIEYLVHPKIEANQPDFILLLPLPLEMAQAVHSVHAGENCNYPIIKTNSALSDNTQKLMQILGKINEKELHRKIIISPITTKCDSKKPARIEHIQNDLQILSKKITALSNRPLISALVCNENLPADFDMPVNGVISHAEFIANQVEAIRQNSNNANQKFKAVDLFQKISGEIKKNLEGITHLPRSSVCIKTPSPIYPDGVKEIFDVLDALEKDNKKDNPVEKLQAWNKIIGICESRVEWVRRKWSTGFFNSSTNRKQSVDVFYRAMANFERLYFLSDEKLKGFQDLIGAQLKLDVIEMATLQIQRLAESGESGLEKMAAFQALKTQTAKSLRENQSIEEFKSFIKNLKNQYVVYNQETAEFQFSSNKPSENAETFQQIVSRNRSGGKTEYVTSWKAFLVEAEKVKKVSKDYKAYPSVIERKPNN